MLGQTVLTKLSAGLKLETPTGHFYFGMEDLALLWGLKLETSLGHFYFGMEDLTLLWLVSKGKMLAQEQIPCATPG